MQAAFGWEMAWLATVRGRAPLGRSPGSDAGAGTNGQLDAHTGVRVDALAVSLATS